jgi:hypothetical protein
LSKWQGVSIFSKREAAMLAAPIMAHNKILRIFKNIFAAPRLVQDG